MRNRLLKGVAALALSAVLATSAVVVPVVPQTAITVEAKTKLKTYTSKLTVTLGKNGSFKKSIKGTVKSVKSSKTNIATVKKNGTITPKKAGKTVVTVTTNKGIYKITVTVPNASLNKTKATIDVGKSVKLTARNLKGFKWSSSNTKIATVSSSGKVTGKKAGTAKITAKVGKIKLTCTVTVKAVNNSNNNNNNNNGSNNQTTVVDDFDFNRDCKITYGTENIYIEFDLKEGATEAEKQELKNNGLTVESGKAKGTIPCPTATYTFTKLPTTLDGLKRIRRNADNDYFAPMAMGIVAMTTYETMTSPDAQYDHPIYDYFEYINGDIFEITKPARSGIYYSMKPTLEKGKYCYFQGASPSNSYTPNKPYTFKLVLGPYKIGAKEDSIAYGPTPERLMILVSFAGDDSQRYMDVWRSSNGNWYCWDDSWQHLVAGIKDVAKQW